MAREKESVEKNPVIAQVRYMNLLDSDKIQIAQQLIKRLAQGLRQPMLILQAEGDYQVTMQDFQNWEKALGARSDVQFKSYPGLYHLFMPVEGGGKATPAAYSVPGHVVVEVINNIAQWVKHVL
jgi:alpha-beta hydrolase superfamily lysophospholipase